MINRIERLQAFLEKSPEDSFLIHALALEYVKAQNYADAENWFKTNLAINSKYLPTYYHLGKLLVLHGRNEEALSFYQEGVEIARMQNDQHQLRELNAAILDIEEA